MSPDDELMDRLRHIADDVDGPPDIVAETARAAFTTRRLDDELAELLQDSALAASDAVRLAEPGPRLLSFEAGEVSLELQLEQARDGIVLRGLMIGTTGDVEIETATATRTAAVDEQGWFRIDGLPAGPIRVRVRAGNGVTVSTGWIRS